MVGEIQYGHITTRGAIDGVAHELAGEVEEGEHGPGTTGIALVMQLQSLGQRLLSGQPRFALRARLFQALVAA